MEKRELQFTAPTFTQRLKGMLGVDFYRLFHTPLFYIFLVIAAIIPAMILGTMGMENPQTGTVSPPALQQRLAHHCSGNPHLRRQRHRAVRKYEHGIHLRRDHGIHLCRARL